MTTENIKPGSVYKNRNGLYARVVSVTPDLSAVTIQTRQGSPGRFKSTFENTSPEKLTKNFKLVGAK